MKVSEFLVKAKVLDPDGTLSHTSLLLSVAIGRLALFPADAYTVGILTLALAHSNAKRFASHKARQHADAVKGLADADKVQLALLQTEVRSIQSNNALKNLGR